MTIEEFLNQFDDWEVNRDALSEAEESGQVPDPDEWESSDDIGIQLLHDAAELLRRLKS